MGKLFVKIFIAFWLVICAVLGTWVLVSNYFAEQPAAAWYGRDKPKGPPHRFMLRSLYELQNAESRELAGVIKRAKQRHDVDIYLMDSSGEELLQRDVPAHVAALAQRLDGPRRRVFQNHPDGRLIAHELYRSDLGNLRAVFRLTPPKGAARILGGNPWLLTLLAVFISGLVCYGLSRLLTSRLKALQIASRRLANGELDTRLQVRERGGDETDELARDFNSMAAQLQERIQAQKRLLGDVSHELRTPLARLRIALALVEADEGNRAHHIQRLEREAERLEELIAQLLGSEAGDLPMDVHIDLVPLLRQLCADAGFEGRPQGKSVRLTTSLDAAIVKSGGDLLRKCFDNLLRNALTYTQDDSCVEVALDDREGHYVITIIDRGPGVPEHELKRIFDAFYRVDTARSRESGGHGLGLSIARRAVEQHGGRIEASNTGEGLKITLSLPQGD